MWVVADCFNRMNGYWPHLPVNELDRNEKICIVGTRRVQNWSSKKQKVVKTSFMENTEYKCQSRTIPKFILCTSLSHSYYAAFWDNPKKKLLSVLAHNFLAKCIWEFFNLIFIYTLKYEKHDITIHSWQTWTQHFMFYSLDKGVMKCATFLAGCFEWSNVKFCVSALGWLCCWWLFSCKDAAKQVLMSVCLWSIGQNACRMF